MPYFAARQAQLTACYKEFSGGHLGRNFCAEGRLTASKVMLTLGGMDTALDKAIKAAGGAAALARHLGITSQAISQWDRVPVTRAAAVERLTGIPRAELRPDVFGEAA